jgi:hypothetical protein
MDHCLSRRRFLALPLLSLLLPGPVLGSSGERTVRAYEANVGVLFNLLTFTLAGTVTQEIDRAAGRYRVTINGKGPGVTAGSESTGIIRGGRLMPTETRTSHIIRGHENRLALNYDYDRGLVEYHALGYTFLLGRRRQVDDLVRLVPGQHVDDLISAELNFAANALDRDPDGAFRITVVRRARQADEGPDDVSPGGYHAELATVRFHAAPDKASGRLTALVDLTGFSSWARSAHPAQVAFGPDRHLESVSSALILGTTFTLHLAPAS